MTQQLLAALPKLQVKVSLLFSVYGSILIFSAFLKPLLDGLREYLKQVTSAEDMAETYKAVASLKAFVRWFNDLDSEVCHI